MNTMSKSMFVIGGRLFAMAAFLLIISSCTQPAGTYIPDSKDSSSLGKIDHFIKKGDIESFKKDFLVQRDSLGRNNPGVFIPNSETFNKAALLEILKDPKCVGMRMYYGLKKGDKRNEFRLILVGVDEQGNDLFVTRGSAVAADAGGSTGGAEFGQCTPPCR